MTRRNVSGGLRAGGLWSGVVDLAAPVECAGCGQPRERWCAECAQTLTGAPIRVRTRAHLEVPVWALARYGGPPARAVSAHKDRGRADLAAVLGSALAGGVDALRAAGQLAEGADRPLVLVPAPTSARARRSRGVDHVRRIVSALAADLHGGGPGQRTVEPVAVAPLLELRGRVRDSAGLDADARARNLSGRVHRRSAGVRFAASEGAPSTVAEVLSSRCTVLVVDDVVTTGTTLAACVGALVDGGLTVDGGLCVAAA